MSTARAGMRSEPPKAVIQPYTPKKKPEKSETKKELYQNKCWKLDDYRKHSPGEKIAPKFLEFANADEGATVIDWGTGTGRGAMAIHKERPDLKITMIDFADNCLDTEVAKAVEENDNLHFAVEDLSEPSDYKSQYGFCADVLEHIEEEDIDRVLENILYSSKHVFFQIHTLPSGFSHHEDIAEELHVCQHDYHWWLKKFAEHAVVVERSFNLGSVVVFYVTGWAAQMLMPGAVNTEQEKILSNIEENSKLGLTGLSPFGTDPDVEVMLVCGGPSINDFVDEIREHRENGVKLITTNGSYNWAIEHGLKPSMQCIVDAREFNKRFTEQHELTAETKYAIATQCDPSIFETLPLDRTYLWHVSLSDVEIEKTVECFGELNTEGGPFPVPGGSTVGLRALCLLQMLGFRKIYVYGMDSCVFPDEHHHGYEQEENDYIKGTLPVTIAAGTKYEKTFDCQPWQSFQLMDLQGMLPRFAEVPDLRVQFKGEGAIAYYIKTMSELE